MPTKRQIEAKITHQSNLNDSWWVHDVCDQCGGPAWIKRQDLKKRLQGYKSLCDRFMCDQLKRVIAFAGENIEKVTFACYVEKPQRK